VPAGNAEALAKTLQDVYKASSTIRISAVGTNQIMVWAGPDDQFEIARHIVGSTASNTTTELLPLAALDAARTADTLKGMFGDVKTGAPYIEADATRNALIVKGTREQVAEVRSVLKALGEGGNGGGNVRVITLGQGSAATLAEALERLLPQMRKNPVRVITPTGEERRPEPIKEKPRPEEKEKPKDGASGKGEASGGLEPPGNGAASLAVPAGGARPPAGEVVAQGDDKQLADPQEKKEPARNDRPGRADAPVTITAFGNRLILTSEDPAALALAQELVRLLTQTPGGEGDFEIIKLKNASAVEAAKILDEAFNGTKPQSTQSRGDQGSPFGFFSRFSAPAATPPATPSANRIRVVADPATNSLLIRATPLDMLTIRRLLDKAIDAPETESKAVMRTWIIGPLKYANANEVASVVRDVYREQMNNNPNPASPAGLVALSLASRSFSSGGIRNMNVDANGNPRTVTLSLGVDDRSNSLVAACSEAMYHDLKRLVDQLETAAKDSTRTVKVISIRGIDPLLVQQAIDAIQGRRSTFRTSTLGDGSTGSGFGISPSFVPFGSGGLVPGGMSPFRSRGGGSFPGGGPPGSGRLPGSSDLRGPDFFAQRVTDDPQLSLLYDPQPSQTDGSPLDIRDLSRESLVPWLRGRRPSLARSASAGSSPPSLALQASEEDAEEQQPPDPSGAVQGPRSPVTAEALQQLGIVVISGNNPADVEEVLKIIEYLQKLGAPGDIQIQMYPLEHADATSVAATLTRLYQDVILSPGSTRLNPTQRTTTVTQQGQTTTEPNASVLLVPLPRFNALLVAAPRARMEDVVTQIKELDRPTPPQSRPTPFPLKKAVAARVATLLQQFYAQRYPNETAAQHQIRVTFDESTNTLFVQAAPADLAEIRGLVERIDNTVSSAINEMRIVPLRNALAEELSTLLLQAISQGFVQPSAVGAGIVPSAAGALGQRQPGAAGQLGTGQLGTAAGLTGGVGQAGLGQLGGLGQAGQTGLLVKSTTLRFISSRRNGHGVVESGLLEDIHITPDPRTNTLIIAAPAQTIELLLALVRELDVVPAARAEVKIFTLKRADAAATAILLQQLFLGTGGQATGAAGAGPGAAPGAGVGAGVGAAAAGALGGLGVQGQTFGGAVGIPRPLLTLGGTPAEGAPLIDLRLTIDQRTNSVIVAGSRHDLDVIEALISRLEDSDVQCRQNEVVKLKNASAADVAAALQNFVTRSLQVLSQGQQLTAFQEILRDVVVVPEPVTNSLLISATPQYFTDILRLIHEMDAEPPQVVIQVLIAEVDLNDTDEFGVEVGLQSPVLFNRSVVPLLGNLGTSGNGVTYTNNGGIGVQVPPGVTVNNSFNPTALPGFNWNNTNFFSQPLGNNPLVNPAVVGFQGLSNLNVGRAQAGTNIGGFVFSAASDSFNLLIRALRTQSRLDILSRPQIMTLDNQAARILVGQSFPYSLGTNTTATGVIVANVAYRNIGVQLDVVPRISCDGKVFMRVTPEISSVVPGTINLGNNTFATAFNVQTVDTTVVCQDGETVAIGGLIQKQTRKTDNKIPWFGDLPVVGSLFRFRNKTMLKTELLVILTPHIVRSRAEAERILAEEARRVDMLLGDVTKIHGAENLGPILPSPDGLPGIFGPPTGEPPGPTLLPLEPGRPDVLPPPRPVPNGASDLPGGPAPTVLPGERLTPTPAGESPGSSSAPGQEKSGWNPFRRN
jgi:type II secretion system protein D